VAFKVGNQTVIDIDIGGGTRVESALDKDVVLYPGDGGEIYIPANTSLTFEGSSPPDDFEGRLKATTLTADREYTLPDHLYEVSGGGESQGMIAVLDVTLFPRGDIATYVDDLIAATTTAYIDADELQTTELQGYTDQAELDAIASSNLYTDGRETAITTAYQSYTDQAELDAIASSNLYTDGRETAITTAYQLYAADADVVVTDAYIAADVVVTDAYTLADTVVTDAYTLADTVVTDAYIAADALQTTALQGYTDVAEADAINTSNAYTDGREAAITTAYQSYADTAEADAITSSNSYTDGRETAITTAYQSYADTAEADAINTSNSYTDGRETAITTAYQSYADTAEADAINTSNSYTDGREVAITTAYQSYADTAEADAIVTSNAYTDGREAAITTAYQSYADQAEADAITSSNSYTDGRETVITTAYQSYADISEADAITSSNAYTDGKTTKAYIDSLNIQSASVDANSVALGTDTTGNYIATVAGTVNEIVVTGSGSETSAVTVGLATDVNITNDLTIGGDLFVTGSTVSVGSANLSVDDSFIYLNQGDAIGAANTIFTGAGLDDGFLGGYFEGTTSVTYYVRIDANGTPDTFEWSKDNFVTTVATGITIDGTDQALDNNITIKFSATTGHTLGDVWSGTAAPLAIDTGIFSNINTGTSAPGYTHVGVFYDASALTWKVFSEYDPEPNGDINTGDASFVLGKMEADCFIANDIDINGPITNANHATHKAYVDASHANAINASNSYTDGRETAITTAYQSYTDTAEADAIATAALDATTKANTAESNANAYTDGRETAITTAYQSYADTAEADAIATASLDATTKANTAESNANAYTDGRETAITTAYQSYADTAEADAIATASLDATSKADAALSSALAADTDTTYLVGDGGLTEKNFTTADNTKLDGIATSANNYVHPSSHAISFITGLQTALNAKVDDSQVLTNVPSGALFTDTTYSVGNGGLTQVNFTTADNTKLDGIATSANNYVHPSSHPISFITGLQTSLNGKVDDSQVLTNVPAGAVFTDTTYSVGDGGLSQINFTSADHSKLNGIETGATADQSASQILAAIKTVDINGTGGINAGTLGGALPSQAQSNSTIVERSASGYIYANFYNGTGTFSTSGTSSGMGLFTGTNGTDTFGRSYTAAGARTLLNVENGATADQSAAQILTAVKTVDGSGSGLDADLLDGLQGSQYLRSDTADSISGNLTVGAGTSSYIFMVDTDHGNRAIHCNSNNIGFLNSANGWSAYSTDAGLWHCANGLTVTGSIVASGDVTAYSDIRFKHNVETITNAVDTVNNLRGVMFEKDNRQSTGVIAQEVESVFPEVVHTNDEGLKSVAYGNMVGLLIEAVKEQQLQINSLQEEINILKKG